MGEVTRPPVQNFEKAPRELRLLVAEEPRSTVFLQNLMGIFYPGETASLSSDCAPGAFWPDVFVERRLPWLRFLQSSLYHIVALALIWAGSRFLALQPHVTATAAFTHADVVYYSPSEYLPPLDTRSSIAARAQKADPEHSAQAIISVPPEADNRSQTIVTPPNIQLHHDVASANIIALLDKMPTDQRMPIGPAPVVPASEISRIAPRLERSVVAPPPEMTSESRKNMPAPEAAVIAPPPMIETRANSRLGDLDVARAAVIAPAPQLALEEQRALPGRYSPSLHRQAAQVIAPPPSLGAASRSRSGGSLIAISLHPAIAAPPDASAGNRRGSFAATSEGHAGASGAPGSTSGADSSGKGASPGGKANGAGSGMKGRTELPSGLYIGKAANPSPVTGDTAPRKSNAYSVNPNLIANARPPHSAERAAQAPEDSKLAQEERAVFGNRKFYSLSLNMPNLNSAGGSWIIRFAALNPDSSNGSPAARAADTAGGELSSPSATSKVDPAYPLELMRQNLGGTVILYAVIHANGSVGNVRVLRSIDQRLDRYASDAIAKWKFNPATKNGAPVDVEATFWIPFRPARVQSSF